MEQDPFVRYCKEIISTYEKFDVAVAGTAEVYGMPSFHVLAGRATGYPDDWRPMLWLADASPESIAVVRSELSYDVIQPDGKWVVRGLADELHNFRMIAQNDLLDAEGNVVIDPLAQPQRVGSAAIQSLVVS